MNDRMRPDATTRLRALLESDGLEFLIEAHSGLSAKVAEEAGFSAIWASGLSISAQLGVRDNNEASWTQVLEVAEFMADATSIPILLDGDTGYGDFSTVRRVVRKLEQRGIAGICLEDKLYPKRNSFLAGNEQPLAEVEEFVGKIAAARDALSDDDFCVVARTEAFVAGWGLGEAIDRAEAYRRAGADAILVHSAQSGPAEIAAFMGEWEHRCPVIIVPTKYYTTPTAVFRELGVSAVIWANHLLRASLAAMQRTAATLHEEETLLAIEDEIAPVDEVFRLTGATSLLEEQARYGPNPTARPTVIILAASRGTEMGELTADRPKTMVSVRGKPILGHIVDTYNEAGIKDIVVVSGYRSESIDLPNIRTVDNRRYADTLEVASLTCALADTDVGPEGVIVCLGDVLFKKYVAMMLLDTDAEFAISVDAGWRDANREGRTIDLVRASEPPSQATFYRDASLVEIATDIPETSVHGEWMGFLRIAQSGVPVVRELLEKAAREEGRLDSMRMSSLIREIVENGHEVRVLYTVGHWLDVNTLSDLVAAGAF